MKKSYSMDKFKIISNPTTLPHPSPSPSLSSQHPTGDALPKSLPKSQELVPSSPSQLFASHLPDDNLHFVTDIGEDLGLSIGIHPTNKFQTSVTAVQHSDFNPPPSEFLYSSSATGLEMETRNRDMNARNGITEASQTLSLSSPPRKKTKGEKRLFKETERKPILDLDSDNWARYFVIRKKEGSFTNDCSFKMAKFFKSVLGKTKSVKKLGDGTLCIEAETKAQAEVIKSITKLHESDVEAGPHRRLNTSQGVITCRDFLNSTIEDIKEGLEGEGVVDVRRIKRRQGDTLVDTASLVLTFDKPKPPTSIEAAFYKLKVRPYIPSPMRCYRCQKFGHTSQRCRATEQLCVCGKSSHEGECTPPIICVNCSGEHTAKSSQCPVLKEEKEIQKLKTLQQLPYAEAKAIVKSKAFVNPETSFAEKARTAPSVFTFKSAQANIAGQTNSAPSSGLRGNIVKVGEIPPPKLHAPTTGAPVAVRLPSPRPSFSGGIPEARTVLPQVIAPPVETWQVVGPSRRSQRRRDPQTSSPYPSGVRVKQNKTSAGDVRVSNKQTNRRSPRPKWEMVGTEAEASESDGGGTSDRPVVRRPRGRQKKNISN